MKYRIKKEIDWHSLIATYIPQYLSMWLFWSRFVEYDHISSYYPCFESEEKAREYINMKRAKKCTSSSYIYL
jgi:hypothetical protein